MQTARAEFYEELPAVSVWGGGMSARRKSVIRRISQTNLKALRSYDVCTCVCARARVGTVECRNRDVLTHLNIDPTPNRSPQHD